MQLLKNYMVKINTADAASKIMLMLIVTIFISFSGCIQQTSKNKNSLKEIFKNNFLVGAALNAEQILERDTIANELIKTHYNSITAENAFKWEHIHPEPDSYDFNLQDKFVAYGKKNGMFNIGHVLIWHNQTPQWVYQDEKGKLLTRESLLQRMKNHIESVVGRYKGQIKGWDVVNEALEEDGSMRQSEWLKIIGEDYVIKAFEFAHNADPDAELYYNDFSLENEPKRNGAVNLIKKIIDSGVRIDGVGLQGHYKLDWPEPPQVDSTIKAFAALGLKVLITELDIDVLPYDFGKYTADINHRLEGREELNPYKNGLPDSMQRALANRYVSLFKIFTSNKAVKRVTFWGVSDKDSWLNHWPIRNRINYPLLFDREGKPKTAFKAVIKVYND